ncbi:GNAT family N-acetyltransferase [bacterium SCSIO 12643]|nr:GNAT family N-acetyltransferase [bacterium SCSIO 12643]
MEIKSATISDAQQLTTLTLASKSYWGYTPEQMKSWTDDLTITEEYIQIHQVFKLENDHTILGYYSTYESSPDQIKLDNLFILPSHIGKGLGKTLLDHCIKNARQQGYQSIELDADPHAESFYSHFGFKTIDQIPTSIPGRFLPVMALEI